MDASNVDDEPGICQTDPGDWGSFPGVVFGQVWLSIGTRVHDIVPTASAGLLAMFARPLLTMNFIVVFNDNRFERMQETEASKASRQNNNPSTHAPAKPIDQSCSSAQSRQTVSFEETKQNKCDDQPAGFHATIIMEFNSESTQTNFISEI